MKPEWKKRIIEGDISGTFPIKMWDGESGEGYYFIEIMRRPSYCDRGDWLIWVGGVNDLDEQDGFPRYFIGTEEEVIAQMEKWLERRDAYLRYELTE